jgi:hypothetical protein
VGDSSVLVTEEKQSEEYTATIGNSLVLLQEEGAVSERK